jgi:adenylate kinase family enzyme
MTDILPVAALGRRIMIMGPTNAGKSTLAVALANALGIPAMHVDLFRHFPHSDWQQRPDAEFKALHDAAIAEPEWVMEGNYSRLLPQRIARATGIIVIDDRLWRRCWRYFRRTLSKKPRAGGLEGGQDSIKWAMLHWLWHTRNGGESSRERAKSCGRPYVFAQDQRELDQLYAAWGLTRPSA